MPSTICRHARIDRCPETAKEDEMSWDRRPEDAGEMREMVREGYTNVAERASSCCGGTPPHAAETARKLGYSEEELEAAPEGANLGLGCGNPTAIVRVRSWSTSVRAPASMPSWLRARSGPRDG
jgi:hypothetical protein